MAKTEKELQELKVKVEELNKELRELSEEELDKVAGGVGRLGSSNHTGVQDASVHRVIYTSSTDPYH